MSVGFRETKLSTRCKGCKHLPQGIWCQKYGEDIHYCVMTCIDDHPICERDHPVIRRKIQLRRIVRIAAPCGYCCLSTCEGCSTASKLDVLLLPLPSGPSK